MSSVTLDQSLVTMLLSALLQHRSAISTTSSVQPVGEDDQHRRTQDLEKKLADLSTELTKVVTRLDLISKLFMVFVAPLLLLILTAQASSWMKYYEEDRRRPAYTYSDQEPRSRKNEMGGVFPGEPNVCPPETTIANGIDVRGRFL